MVSKLLRSSAVAALCLGSLSGQFVSAQQQFIAPVPIKITNSAAFPLLGPFIAVGDFNGDGRKDILTQSTTGLVTLLRNSDGSYTAISSGVDPNGACTVFQQAADLNGNGRLSVVGISSPGGDSGGHPIGPSTLCVALGNGDGTFSAQPGIDLGGDIETLDLVADLNKDGKSDLIIDAIPCFFVTPDGCGPTNNRTFRVLTSLGGGQFGGLNLPVPPDPNSQVLATGDFKDNGYPDVVVQTNSRVQIFNNTNGTGFTAGAIYQFNARLAAAGDLNHDGKMDLVLAALQPLSAGGHAPAVTGQILLGNGDSTFRTGTTFGPPSLATGASLFVGDVNGDSLPDIALTVLSPSNTTGGNPDGIQMQIFAGNGTGTVGFPSVFNIGSAEQASLVDVNNDGKLDLLVLGPGAYFSPGAATFAIAANAGKGFLLAPRITSVYIPNSIVKADFNKDGIEDVAVVSDATVPTGRGSVVVLPGSGKGYFNAAKSYPIGMASGVVAVGDVNHDGIMDLVVARSASYLSTHPGESNTTDLSVLLGNADGTFKPAMNFTVLGAPPANASDNFAALADVNHDGKLDLIGDWGVALGKGDGTFAAPIPLPASLQNISAIAGGDFNHDGVLDLAVATTMAGTNNNRLGVVSTLIGNGKGGYVINGQQQLANTFAIQGVGVADIDGDGKPDLIFYDSYFSAAGPGVDALVVRLGNGNGTFAPSVIHPLATSNAFTPHPFLVGDFNRDGKPDVLILAPVIEPGQQLAGGDITLYFGLGGGKLSTTPQYFQTKLDDGVVLNLDSVGGLDVAGFTTGGVTRLLNTGSRATVTK